MADQRIIDLTAITTQSDTDLYETSLNGTGSRKETRLQMRTNMQTHFNSVYLQVANNLSDVANAFTAFNNIAPTTTKGDLIVNDGAGNIRQPVGIDGYSLVASSGSSTGLTYALVGGVVPVPRNYTNLGNQTLPFNFTNSTANDLFFSCRMFLAVSPGMSTTINVVVNGDIISQVVLTTPVTYPDAQQSTNPFSFILPTQGILQIALVGQTQTLGPVVTYVTN